jgi:small subunit ribosomal protein S20
LTKLDGIGYTSLRMPITKQAEKKLRHDKKRTMITAKQRANVRTLIKDYRKTPSKKGLAGVFKALDKAAKLRIIHANKAARLKSRLSKLISK